MATATWSSLFSGDTANIRKALYGSVLVKEYSLANNFATYSPFDTATGELSSTLLTTDGWLDCGFLTDDGVEFSPQYSTTATTGWQSRDDLRVDVTRDAEEAAFTLLESTPLVDALRENLALPTGSTATPGASGYSYAKTQADLVYRSFLFIGVDGNQFAAKLYPRAVVTKPDKQSWNAKTEQSSQLTVQPFPDHAAGFSRKTFRDGPAWRAMAEGA